MSSLQQLLTSLTALVMTLSAQVGNLSQSITPQSQLAQVAATPAFVQGATANNYPGTSSQSVSFSSNTLNGNTIAGYIFWTSSVTLNSVSGCGNTYNLLHNPTVGSFRAAGFYAPNISGGACTITATFSGDPGNARILAHEISGLATMNPLDVSALRYQSNGGVAIDGVSSGSVTTNVDGDYIFGATSGDTNSTMTAGTGFTSRLAATGAMMTEDKIQAIAGPVATTFKSNTNFTEFYTLIMAFKPSTYSPPPTQDTTPPSTPTNLSATAVSSSQINLSWNASTDNVGVTGYDIYRNGSLLTSVTGTSYSNTGLTASTQYSYTVRSKDAAGNTSSQSSSVSATTQASSPTLTPPSISSFSSSPSSIQSGQSSTLSWSVTGNPTPTLSINPGNINPSSSSGSTSVSPSQTTTYTLTATNSQGSTNANTTVTVSATPPSDTTPPSTPTSLSATAVSSSQINLSWTASTDNIGVTGYDIYRNGTLLTSTVTNNYNNTGLSASTQYSYTVRAKDVAGNTSAQSSSVSATTQAGTPPPTNGEIIPSDRIVSWQGNVGVEGGIPSSNWPICSISITAGASTATIQNALNNCPANSVVYLPTGTYSITSTLKINRNNIALRGSGNTTILRGASGVPGIIQVSANAGRSYPGEGGSTPSRNIVSGLTKGSTSITTSVAHGWNVGDYILIDQKPNVNDDPPVYDRGSDGTCSWCGRADGGSYRVLGQWVKVIGVPSPNTATINIPLYVNYNLANTPQGVKVTEGVHFVGIENMLLDNTTSRSGYIIQMEFPINSWVDGIEFRSTNSGSRYNLDVRGGTRTTIRDSYFNGIGPVTQTSSQAYGFRFIEVGSAFLIENNIFQGLMVSGAFEGGWGGNVLAYNYSTQPRYPNEALRSSFAAHGPYPFMNLFEGNYNDGNRMIADRYFGNSGMHTLFRNKIKLDNQNFSAMMWGIDYFAYVWYNNIIGNVLGAAGVETVYEQAGARNYTYDGEPSIYRFGYADAVNTNTGSYVDPKVKSSTMRWGNFDYVNNITRWATSEIPTNIPIPSTQNIPSSLYLTSKPNWWPSGMNFPAYGPNPNSPGTLLNGNIPAQACFNATPTNPDTISSCLSGTVTPPPTTYTITSSAGSGGTITPSGTITLNSGSSQTFTFTPNTGYRVSNVTVNGSSLGSVSSYTFNNITSNQSISVSFSLVTPIVGDFNSDGLVNSIDLSLLTGAWNTSNSTYDLTRDGLVNSLDYTIMVQNWSV